VCPHAPALPGHLLLRSRAGSDVDVLGELGGVADRCAARRPARVCRGHRLSGLRNGAQAREATVPAGIGRDGRILSRWDLALAVARGVRRSHEALDSVGLVGVADYYPAVGTSDARDLRRSDEYVRRDIVDNIHGQSETCVRSCKPCQCASAYSNKRLDSVALSLLSRNNPTEPASSERYDDRSISWPENNLANTAECAFHTLG
jgi:hypothetical protein